MGKNADPHEEILKLDTVYLQLSDDQAIWGPKLPERVIELSYHALGLCHSTDTMEILKSIMTNFLDGLLAVNAIGEASVPIKLL